MTLPEDDGLFKKQKLGSEETLSKTNIPVIESSKKPAKGLEIRETEQKERHDPISYWIAHHIWPESFAEHNSMTPKNLDKRQRTSDHSQNDRLRSYTECLKNKEVPVQYTAAYQNYILTQGLNMDILEGKKLISKESEKLCVDLQKITHKTIESTTFSTEAIKDVIDSCQNRNEAIVNRDITPLIVPSIPSLYFGGDNSLKHVIDEVNVDWNQQCVLTGPRVRSDLAIGLFSSAFTEEEIDKLKRYTSVDNWTQVTVNMYFPFLMCEVKCGREGLDAADRQNMQSCSVAVRALLRIEQEADKYRSEKKMDNLMEQILVFSISHDQQDVRLWGHYAIVQQGKWTYYRYRIKKFDLMEPNDVLAIHNFVRNILKFHLPEHVRRLKNALAAFPVFSDSNKLSKSTGLSDLSGLSFAALTIPLNDDNFQEDSRNKDADGFVVLALPGSSQNSKVKKKERGTRLTEQIEKLIEERRRHTQEHEEKMDKLLQQLVETAGD